MAVSLVALGYGCVMFANHAQAGRSPALPVAHAEVIRDFARITFEWPDPTYFTAAAEGNTVSISFDRQANPDFGALLRQLHPYVKHASRQADGRTIVLTLNKPYRIRTFVSDNLNGIDLLEIEGKPAKRRAEPRLKRDLATKKAEKPQILQNADAALLAALSPAAGAPEEAAVIPDGEAPAETPITPAAQAEQPPAEQTEPVQALAEQAPTAEPVEESPAAQSAETPQRPEETAAAATPTPEAAPAEMSAPEQQTVQEQPSATPPENIATPPDGAVPQRDAETPVPLSYTNQDNVVNKDYLKIGLSLSEDNAVLRFPLAERVAMATFVRGRTLWVVINKNYTVDVSDFKTEEDKAALVRNPQQVPAAKSTILRFDLDESMHVSVTRESSSFNWAILLTTQERPLLTKLRPDIRTDPPAPPHVFIPVLETADPIAVHDPQVGDEVVIVPLYQPGEGVARTVDFVEFTLMDSAQGIALLKKADEVRVALQRDGLRVTVSNGETLTPGLPMVELKDEQQKLVEGVTLFPYNQWRIGSQEELKPQLKKLFQLSVKHTEVKNANESRLQMVKIYMAEGMASEALGLLEIIREKDPAFYRSQKLAALQGAADFLMYRYADAARDFAAGELDNIKEVDFWRKVIADLLGNPDQDYDFMALNDDYISKYPPEMRRRLVIVAADRAISEKDYNMALKIIESMSNPELTEPVKDYIRFLMASISAGTGQETEALEIWDELAENFDEPFVRASAELSRIMWGMAHEELTTAEAVERMERLRLSWHGDRLELQVIRELGKIYEDKNDYVNAMRIWHGGITSFPNSSLAGEMKEKMQHAFNFMFSQGGVDKLPPLDVLAMYYEYRNYAPTGGAGSDIIEKLSERLISIDLLAQAAELLDSQMRYIAEKEQRSQLGAQLAEVHLLNNQPQKALEALQDSLYGENSLLLRLVRNRLAARAMTDQERLTSALQVLGQDTSIEAERIRLTVYWKQRNWQKVIGSVEDLLKEREDVTAQVTLDEAEALLKLALAYVFENNDIQLQYLRDYFLPLMKDNPYREVFDYVTRGEMVVTTTNFDDIIQNLSDTRKFIDNYRSRITLAGTDEDKDVSEQ
ncbi:MAG: hypothetical protein AB7L92_04065 [Alphaproteobacteria bacterium]